MRQHDPDENNFDSDAELLNYNAKTVNTLKSLKAV